MSTILPYYPAKLYEGATWYIAFYVMDPRTGKLSRRRIKWNRIENISERRAQGKEMCRQINERLARGWNPLAEELASRSQSLLPIAAKEFLKEKQKRQEEGTLREDTMRSYRSYLSMLEQHIPHWKHTNCVGLQRESIIKFLDFIYHDLARSARTRNNYLGFIHNFCEWLISKGFMYVNPALGLRKIPESEKKRKIIPTSERQRIFEHLKENDYGYYVLCLVEYYLFIRRTEITKLRVHHFDLDQSTVLIPAQFSKNRKDDTITIPKTVGTVLRRYLKNAPGHYYFTGPGFKPAKKALQPKKISDQWTKLRSELGFLKSYQFYSLKDTGITDMLRAGIPSIIVRDQARHYDVSQTDQYAARGKSANAQIEDFN